MVPELGYGTWIVVQYLDWQYGTLLRAVWYPIGASMVPNWGQYGTQLGATVPGLGCGTRIRSSVTQLGVWYQGVHYPNWSYGTRIEGMVPGLGTVPESGYSTWIGGTVPGLGYGTLIEGILHLLGV